MTFWFIPSELYWDERTRSWRNTFPIVEARLSVEDHGRLPDVSGNSLRIPLLEGTPELIAKGEERLRAALKGERG